MKLFTDMSVPLDTYFNYSKLFDVAVWSLVTVALILLAFCILDILGIKLNKLWSLVLPFCLTILLIFAVVIITVRGSEAKDEAVAEATSKIESKYSIQVGSEFEDGLKKLVSRVIITENFSEVGVEGFVYKHEGATYMTDLVLVGERNGYSIDFSMFNVPDGVVEMVPFEPVSSEELSEFKE